MAILGTAALLFFGPDQLPKVARKVGLFMRDVQNTSQSFVREMERAADDPAPGGIDLATAHETYEPPVYEHTPWEPSPSNGATHEGTVAPPEHVDPWWNRISESKPDLLPEPPPKPSGGYQLPP